jgi:sodium transport system permease protein
LGVGTFATIFLITVPMVLLAVPLQLLIAAYTRSFKEAQNYLSLLPLVPALPGMFLAFLPVKPALWAMLIPTFGQQILINQVMRGEAVDPLHVAAATAVTVLLGVGITALVVRLFARERILFGR